MRKPGWVRDAHRRYAALYQPPIAPNAIPNLYAQHTGGLGLTVTNPTLNSANDFSNGNWTKTNTTIIINNTTGPTGLLDADRVTDTVTSAAHQVSQNATGANVLGYATISVYAKAGTANFAILSGNSGAIQRCFNLTTGTVGASTGAVLWATATDAGTGWWLLKMTYLTTNANVAIGMNVTNSVSSYAGAGDYIYLYTAAMTQDLTTTWTDQTGNGRNMTQSTAIAAPVSIDYPVDGAQAAMYFDGDNTRTLAATPADWTFLHNGAGMTWAGVVAPDGTTPADTLNRRLLATASFTGSGGTTRDVGITLDYRVDLGRFAFNTYNAPSATNMTVEATAGSSTRLTPCRVIVRFSSTDSPNCTIWINGALSGSGNLLSAASASAPFYALRYGTIDIAYYKGWLLDSYFYDRTLSDYEIIGLDRYLKIAYNL